jgi:hypothetical protein
MALDALIVTALSAARPSERVVVILRGWVAPATLRPVFVTLASAVVLVGLGYVSLVLAGREPSALFARWRGDFLVISPAEADLGSGPPGESVTTEVTLTNVGERALLVRGGTSDCQCITTRNLPITLPPGGSQRVHLIVRRSRTPGVQRRQYHFFTDQPQQPRAYARFVSHVVAAPAAVSRVGSENGAIESIQPAPGR